MTPRKFLRASISLGRRPNRDDGVKLRVWRKRPVNGTGAPERAAPLFVTSWSGGGASRYPDSVNAKQAQAQPEGPPLGKLADNDDECSLKTRVLLLLACRPQPDHTNAAF